MNVKKISIDNKQFPDYLRNIPNPPKLLYYIGDLSKLGEKKVVSIVGSRAVTPYGKQITTSLADELARHDVAIVSGLALGVDALAHQAAVDNKNYTVAVLPCGLDQIYPRSHTNLANRILSCGGALLTEYPDGTTPFRTNFIERNRLVSGLCDGLLITEATNRSGTLHTANFALEQGKTVMAVPGNITSPNSSGTNSLIKSGAVPIMDVNDIFNALEINKQVSLLDVIANNPQEAIILDLFKSGVTDINQIQVASELTADVFNQTLTMLEISGKVRPTGGGHWSLH